jgi:hypothetical protein
MKLRTPEPEGFAEFWTVWRPIARHTDGRGLARETYRKHILAGAMPQDIVDGARWFIRSMKERDREYVPLSSTWLNRQSYEDGCEQERAYQQRLAESQEKRIAPPPASREAEPLPADTRTREERAKAHQAILERYGYAQGTQH